MSVSLATAYAASKGSLVLAAADTTTPAAPPKPTSALTGLKQITPDFTAPGVAGMSSAVNTVAAWAIVAGVLAIILGILMVVIGPRLSFQQAKSLGMGGIIGGLAVGGVVAMATTGVSTIYGWFA